MFQARCSHTAPASTSASPGSRKLGLGVGQLGSQVVDPAAQLVRRPWCKQGPLRKRGLSPLTSPQRVVWGFFLLGWLGRRIPKAGFQHPLGAGRIASPFVLLRCHIGHVAKPATPRVLRGDDGRLPVIIGWEVARLLRAWLRASARSPATFSAAAFRFLGGRFPRWCVVTMVTGWSGRRRSKPRHLYAPATHVLPLDIGSEPPRGRTNRSGD